MTSFLCMHQCRLLIDLPLNVVLFTRLYLRKLAIRLTSLTPSFSPLLSFSFNSSFSSYFSLSFPNYYLSPFLFLPLLITFFFSPPPPLHISFWLFLCFIHSFSLLLLPAFLFIQTFLFLSITGWARDIFPPFVGWVVTSALAFGSILTTINAYVCYWLILQDYLDGRPLYIYTTD